MEGTYSLVQRVDEDELVRLCFKLVVIIQLLYKYNYNLLLKIVST